MASVSFLLRSELPTIGDEFTTDKGSVFAEQWQIITNPVKNTTLQGGLYEVYARKNNICIEKRFLIELSQ